MVSFTYKKLILSVFRLCPDNGHITVFFYGQCGIYLVKYLKFYIFGRHKFRKIITMQNIQSLLSLADKEFYTLETVRELEATAEKIISSGTVSDDLLWGENYLSRTRKPEYLTLLPDDSARYKWAEHCFWLLRQLNFGMLDLMKQRTEEHPDKVLFRDVRTGRNIRWTYRQVFDRMIEIAALLRRIDPKNPRVVIYLDNSIDGAVVDLACLSYGIYNMPLNVHFNDEVLAHIFKETGANILVTDNPKRLQRAKTAAQKADSKMAFIITNAETAEYSKDDYFLGKAIKSSGLSKDRVFLEKFPKRPIDQVASTMFTSGSTGKPKGVSFSEYNIVSKRYARAAALPTVGSAEVFICYLPLFHTFGRYLEMTGSVFWGGTYVFSGNPSAATLLSLFPKINPTGFISVPVRWVQIYEECMKYIEPHMNEEEVQMIVRKVVGRNLNWGLSAAGYLDPKIFKFFIRNGIHLNSGFGMTEATGGITMTPPGEYVENSTGIPLPGMQTRLKPNGELELKSHYLARYFDEGFGPDNRIPYPHEDDYWLETGDIFRIDEDGHHEIIDRVKDIYKNSKGQTVAPGHIEKKFTGVPGVKSTFLVGDGRAHNVLLIVPDKDDPIYNSFGDEKNLREYYRQIIMTANKELAPYERIVNFTVLSRDFDAEKGELTPKGTFKRKQILTNFSDSIEELYVSNKIEFNFKDFTVIIPRWLYRDLGILETDISKIKKGIKNKSSESTLTISKTKEKGQFLVGNLIYTVENAQIDLGRMIRQPLLWAGNPELIGFFPCKDSYELPLKQFSAQVCVSGTANFSEAQMPALRGINDSELIFLNSLLFTALYAAPEPALNSLFQIEKLFPSYDKYKADIVRRRLEALACHDSEDLRMNAYRILLSGDPDPDYSQIFPSFIKSGKRFLNTEMIEKIARRDFGKKQLEAFRKRMHAYRKGFAKKQSKQTEQQFETIFQLLKHFGLKNLSYYSTIRAELANWILLKNEPFLAKKAEQILYELYREFEKWVLKENRKIPLAQWEKKIVFDDDFTAKERKNIIDTLSESQFLLQSIIIIYDEPKIKLSDIADQGIWISHNTAYAGTRYYRMVINTKTGKHFDISVTLEKDPLSKKNSERLFRSIALSGYPYGAPVMAKFGCINPKSGAYTTEYVSELTAWERIRTLAELPSSVEKQRRNAWRKLFIRSMSTLYQAWNNCERELMPCRLSPSNVVVSENDFSYASKILSVTGNKANAKRLDMFSALYHHFYLKTVAHYPGVSGRLKPAWIFHALCEAFGSREAQQMVADIVKETEQQTISETDQIILNFAKEYLEGFEGKIYFPLAMFNAIDRFADWTEKNPLASSKAKEQTISELVELYSLQKYPDMVRFKFYGETYFSNISEAVSKKFDKLLKRMSSDPEALPIQFTELSELQEELVKTTDKEVFAKMVFPDIYGQYSIDFSKTEEGNIEKLIVKTHIKDKKDYEYVMRKPIHAEEVGILYKLFYKENYPKQISPMDKHYVVTDSYDRVVGGLCYKYVDDHVVLLDGMAVTSSLHNRGIGSAMMHNFFTLMKAESIKTIKAHFLFGNYYLRHKFRVDQKWGALVKTLD